VSGGGPRTPHRLRSEKPRRGLGRRGFESRHLHQNDLLRTGIPSDKLGIFHFLLHPGEQIVGQQQAEGNEERKE
jgi:hypothetical protein